MFQDKADETMEKTSVTAFLTLSAVGTRSSPDTRIIFEKMFGE